jgi:hypothetical protein
MNLKAKQATTMTLDWKINNQLTLRARATADTKRANRSKKMLNENENEQRYIKIQ